MTGLIAVSVSRRNRAVFEWARETARREGRSLSDFFADALRLYKIVRGEEQEDESEDEGNEPCLEDFFTPGEEITAQNLQERFGLSYEAARKRLQRMAQRGVAKRVQRGRYVVLCSPRINRRLSAAYR